MFIKSFSIHNPRIGLRILSGLKLGAKEQILIECNKFFLKKSTPCCTNPYQLCNIFPLFLSFITQKGGFVQQVGN